MEQEQRTRRTRVGLEGDVLAAVLAQLVDRLLAEAVRDDLIGVAVTVLRGWHMRQLRRRRRGSEKGRVRTKMGSLCAWSVIICERTSPRSASTSCRPAQRDGSDDAPP